MAAALYIEHIRQDEQLASKTQGRTAMMVAAAPLQTVQESAEAINDNYAWAPRRLSTRQLSQERAQLKNIVDAGHGQSL